MKRARDDDPADDEEARQRRPARVRARVQAEEEDEEERPRVRVRVEEEEEGETRDDDDDDDDVGNVNTTFATDWTKAERTYDDRELRGLEEERFEPFNLTEERELGTFDQSGSFTWKRRDLDDEEDKEWLEQVGEEVARKKSAKADDDDEREEEMDPATAMKTLVRTLASDDETPEQAIARLVEDRAKFEAATDACSRLLRAGLADVFTWTRARFVQRLGGSGLRWEYCLESDRSRVHGPFPAADMQLWRETGGFFTREANEKCLVRLARDNGDDKHHADDEWMRGEEVESFLYA